MAVFTKRSPKSEKVTRMKKTELKPGTPLTIVFESELNKSKAHYLRASVYDCDDSFVTTSQTSPALQKSFLGRKVLLTYLIHIGARTLRFGFAGLLAELVSDYAMSSCKNTQALLIKRLHRSEPMDFRMYFRIKPPAGSDLSLFWEEKKVGLIDISLGGAQFIYPDAQFFQPGQQVKFKLLIGDGIFDVEGIIRRVGRPRAVRPGKRFQQVSVEFRHCDKKMESSLGKAIMEIERSLLTKGAG